ncbi:hypothetical protein JCM1840_003106 [Sporobolomyces johnsonii]
MRMLDESTSSQTDADTPVTLADQQNINAFSRLNSRIDEIHDELEQLAKQKEDLEEVETEMELIDDDETVMYKLDSTFLHLPASEVLALLQTSLDKVRTEVDRLEQEKQKCDEGMEALKKELYAKFGNSINLERGD